ncbi:hypothetical protein [Haloplasma contractile]|uniref:Uncharacterized protein n=1 Tax=Haloplasma contractile SSD-17B TaxID=1033810 RepID=F7Q0Y3_9MOLU|nr:hypothetical protein [Haloplasma contractile]ERJ11362.1 hypothetical protein HLPCO_002664 [Haloplasma contractile SSD-17B]
MNDDIFPERQYDQIAIVNYFANDYERYNYTTSRLNDYTKKILASDHQGNWFMGEDV